MTSKYQIEFKPEEILYSPNSQQTFRLTKEGLIRLDGTLGNPYQLLLDTDFGRLYYHICYGKINLVLTDDITILTVVYLDSGQFQLSCNSAIEENCLGSITLTHDELDTKFHEWLDMLDLKNIIIKPEVLCYHF